MGKAELLPGMYKTGLSPCFKNTQTDEKSTKKGDSWKGKMANFVTLRLEKKRNDLKEKA